MSEIYYRKHARNFGIIRIIRIIIYIYIKLIFENITVNYSFFLTFQDNLDSCRGAVINFEKIMRVVNVFRPNSIIIFK